MFIDYLVAKGGLLPPVGQCLYEYVIAGNGVFVRAKRAGLEAMIPVALKHINGLDFVVPYVRLESKVPEVLLRRALLWSVDAMPNEALFWFGLDGNTWTIKRPQQQRTRTSVRPMDAHDGFGAGALIDMHSHNVMAPFFSTTDNKDETGFRIYVVVGSINVRSQLPPKLKVRVGVYGHFWEVAAVDVFCLPEFLAGEEDLIN